MKPVLTGLFAVLSALAPVVAAAAAPPAKETETVLYSFCAQQNCTDGESPMAGLIDVNGILYGTAEFGGANRGGDVFAFDPATGAETVLYSFCAEQNCTDGEYPGSSLLAINGLLYGTTEFGGTYGLGSAFELDPGTGTETVLHSFGSAPDGNTPYGGLTDVDGTLYGTTYLGGAFSGGAVFTLDPDTGAETVLYSFCKFPGCKDGLLPIGGLTYLNGSLYGTTIDGGTSCTPGTGCGGTVFAIDPGTGKEAAVYSFCAAKNCADGNYPEAGVTAVNGVLYGTTAFGGNKTGSGTVFALDLTTGKERAIYAFCSRRACRDGVAPLAGVTAMHGKLYGTTSYGGIGGINGAGVVFSVDPATGKEKLVHSFCSQANCTDGTRPTANLLNVKGTLYGITSLGGTNCHGGCGTIFSLTQ